VLVVAPDELEGTAAELEGALAELEGAVVDVALPAAALEPVVDVAPWLALVPVVLDPAALCERLAC
jgi:hypothetical protein